MADGVVIRGAILGTSTACGGEPLRRGTPATGGAPARTICPPVGKLKPRRSMITVSLKRNSSKAEVASDVNGAPRLQLTREQILAFRRSVGALDERLPPGPDSLRRAAWAGLQDSVPRAAVLSIHARVHGTEPQAWEDPSLVQLSGPAVRPSTSWPRSILRSSRSGGSPTAARSGSGRERSRPGACASSSTAER